MPKISKAKLQIYIYDTKADSRPSSPNYTLEKTKLSNEKSIVFEVSGLIKDHIEVDFKGDYGKITDSVFVDFVMLKTYDDDTTETTEQQAVAFNGYGYHYEGINPVLSEDVLISNRSVYVPEGYQPRIPFYTSGEDGIFKITYLDPTGTEVGSVTTASSLTPITADTTDYTADNSTDTVRADTTFIKGAGLESYTNNAFGTSNVRTIKFENSNGSITEINIFFVDECKYTPYRITFVNKFGALQDLFFFKTRKDSIQTTKKEYMHSTLRIGRGGASYDTAKHSDKTLDVNARRSFRMNTGFVSQDHNAVMEQLLLTEYCWITEGNRVMPVKPITTSLDYQTNVNDKLINYEIDFEYANDYIQNVR